MMIFLTPWAPFTRRYKKRYMRPGDYYQAFINNVKLLIALIIFHGLGMWYFEGKSINDAIWLTWATFTTVGYGDMSAADAWGRLTTIFFGTWGIITLPAIVANWLDYRSYKRELQRIHRWRWDTMTLMTKTPKDHIAIVGLPVTATVRYLELLIGEIRGRKEFDGAEIAILSKNIPEKSELPNCLKDDDAGVIFYDGCGAEEDDLKAICVQDAKWVLVLCPNPEHGSEADYLTSAIVYHITEVMGVTVPVIAEAALDRNMEFLKKNGATSTVRATNDFPGIIVSETAAKGSYHIVKDLFSIHGNELNDYPVAIENMPWVEVAYRIGKLGYDFRGYLDVDGNAHSFGETDCVINAEHLYLLAPPGKTVDTDEIRNALKA